MSEPSYEMGDVLDAGGQIDPIHVVIDGATEPPEATAEFGTWQSYSFAPGANIAQQILPQTRKRLNAIIVLNPLESASFDTSGQVTSPAANQSMAFLGPAGAGNIPAGLYSIQWQVELSGTVSATDLNNFALQVNSATLLVSNNPGAVGTYPQPTVTAQLNPGGFIGVAAIGAGTVGAVYRVQIIATPIGAGFVRIGSKGQVMNNAGAQLVAPTQIKYEAAQEVWAVGDGLNPLSIVVLDHRYL